MVLNEMRGRKNNLTFRNLASRSRHAPTRDRRHGEAGFLTFSGIMLFLVIGAILFTAFKLLPLYIDNYRLQDSFDSLARNATYSSSIKEPDLLKQVLEEARLLGIPLEPNQVVVKKAGSNVNISAHYMITVDLLVRQVDLNFAPAAGNRNIMAKP